VATELNQWRRESAFITTLKAENASLFLETNSLRSEISLADSTITTYQTELFIVNRANVRKDSVNQIMATSLSDIHRIASKALEPDRWFERKELWFGVGFLLSLLITR
jgi:hypothetical protein